jgi:hypothetical protein
MPSRSALRSPALALLVGALGALTAGTVACGAPDDAEETSEDEGEISAQAPARACAYGAPDCNTCVEDVVGQVKALDDHGSVLGYRMNGHTPVSSSDHWQGVQRPMSGQGKYLVVSRRGRHKMLDVVEMGSRRAGGVPFLSNRSAPGRDAVATVPPTSDRIVAELAQDPGFDHAGGLQLLGDVLAIPLENGTASRVVFFDVANPRVPRRLGMVTRPAIGSAGTASMARLSNGRVLLIAGRTNASVLDLYVGRQGGFDPDSFKLASTWSSQSDRVSTRLSDGDDHFGAYQSLNFVTQCDGQLFLLGGNRTAGAFGLPLPGTDFLDLYAVKLEGKPASLRMHLTKVAKRHLYCGLDGTRQCSLDAASGAFAAPDHRLFVYSTENASDGPEDTVKMEEFHP